LNYGSPQDTEALDAEDGITPVTTVTSPSPTIPTTNAEWSAEVQSGLTSLGYASKNVSNALGNYFAHKALTSNQANIIQVAVAEFGNPPVGAYAIKKAPGNGNPPPKHGKGIKHSVTSGKDSLHMFAQQSKNTEAQIISDTNTHHKVQTKFAKYVQTGNYSAKLPAGIDLYYEDYGSK
jgi:hypothetical protein